MRTTTIYYSYDPMDWLEGLLGLPGLTYVAASNLPDSLTLTVECPF